jgi:hypothetical protein
MIVVRDVVGRVVTIVVGRVVTIVVGRVVNDVSITLFKTHHESLFLFAIFSMVTFTLF